MKVRKVKNSDKDAFVTLYLEAYKGLEKYAYRKKSAIKHYFKWLLSRDANGFFIAESEKPLGFIACDANWFDYLENSYVGEIHELFVHPNHRRQGVGSILLNKAIKYAKSRNRKTVSLWVGIENYAAKKFYTKFGFVKTVNVGKWTRMMKRI